MPLHTITKIILCLTLSLCLIGCDVAEPTPAIAQTRVTIPQDQLLALFKRVRSKDPETAQNALNDIASTWHPGYRVMLLETNRFTRNPVRSQMIFQLLADKTGQKFGADHDAWFRWLWSQPDDPHPHYAAFKGDLYRRIDDRFTEYFANEPEAIIRLDEVRWGGVRRDGIPPLSEPKAEPAQLANTWLRDDHVVFGVEVNGVARCYPKRILAWHEMVKDTVGGKQINGVYCTLCGSMIVYDPVHKGMHYELGTSGFLYRSNKLMYDHQTKSMWSTLEGKPVIGQLVGKGIQLKRLPVVTSTWGKWKAQHPETTVASLDTGHYRDYGEGVAYREYFSTDRLMFTVPKLDTRLKNKQPILAFRNDDGQGETLAISKEFLSEKPIHHETFNNQKLVILTDTGGASRAFASGDVKLIEYDGANRAIDDEGNSWTMSEAGLTNADGTKLVRIPTHEAFWFGWFSQFPETRLVK